MPSYKEEEIEDASPKALPIPEELPPPPPPEPAVVEPVGDLLVGFKHSMTFCSMRDYLISRRFIVPKISILSYHESFGYVQSSL